MFFFLLGIYLGVKLMDQMVTRGWIIWTTAKLFSKVAAHFTFPLAVCEAADFSHLYQRLLLSDIFVITILMDVKWCIFIVLIYMSPIVNDIFSCVYFPFVHIFLEKWVLRSFAWFFIGLFAFLLFSFKSSLYILGIRPLLDI